MVMSHPILRCLFLEKKTIIIQMTDELFCFAFTFYLPKPLDFNPTETVLSRAMPVGSGACRWAGLA